jgi:transcriptional regulator with XRE-family HTH domain
MDADMGTDETAGLQPEDEPGTGMVAAFGRLLKPVRTTAGMERAELGARLGYAASTIASYEQGRRIPPPKYIDQADEALGARGVLKELKEDVARAQYPAFFRDAAKLGASCSYPSAAGGSESPGSQPAARTRRVNSGQLPCAVKGDEGGVCRVARRSTLRRSHTRFG